MPFKNFVLGWDFVSNSGLMIVKSRTALDNVGGFQKVFDLLGD